MISANHLCSRFLARSALALAILSCVLPLAAGPDEGSEAEKLFRDMEKKINDAKTVECKFDCAIETIQNGKSKGGKFDCAGSLLLGEGNRCNLLVKTTSAGDKKSWQWLTVSDGRTMFGTTGNYYGPEGLKKPSKQALPENLCAVLRSGITRSGLERTYQGGERATGIEHGRVKSTREVDEAFRFSLAGKEKLDGRDVRVIHYNLKSYPPLRVRLWLDADTNLPLQRELIWTGVAGDHTTTEKYTELKLDGAIDPKKFELPEE
jgi:outer membrane lipoprotein-sorting protein